MTKDTSYNPLARKHRPTRFTGDSGLVGQDHVSVTLQNALKSDRVAPAYLFSGPRGTGKTTAARLLAASLNCENRGEGSTEPCAKCESCKSIVKGNGTMNVVEMDAASNRGVDDARDLRESLMYSPTGEGNWKVHIIDEAHMLTREAWNTLLKVLEEPPPHRLFIFCTTEPQKIEQAAPPVLSRCQTFPFRRVSTDAIVEHLTKISETEGIRVIADSSKAPENGEKAVTLSALQLIARRAKGGLRDALSSFDQLITFEASTQVLDAGAVRSLQGEVSEDILVEILELLAKQDRAELFETIARLDGEGVDLALLFDSLQESLVAFSMIKSKIKPEGWSRPAMVRLWNLREAFPDSAIDRLLDLSGRSSATTGGRGDPRLVIDSFLVRAQATLADLTQTQERPNSAQRR